MADEVLVVTRQLNKTLRPVTARVYDPKRVTEPVEDQLMKSYLEGKAKKDIAQFKKDFPEFNEAQFFLDWIEAN